MISLGVLVFGGRMLNFGVSSVSSQWLSEAVAYPNNRWDTLGLADKIYVVSLPRRADRREQMDVLRNALGLEWAYVDAVECTDPVVYRLLNCVQMQRNYTMENGVSDGTSLKPEGSPTKSTFRWPDDIDSLALSDKAIRPYGSDLWSSHSDLNNSEDCILPDRDSEVHGPDSPLLCATQNDNVSAYTPGLPDYRILGPSKIACWHSHLSVIRRTVDEGIRGVTVILEDDIDMEWDIRQRLASVWRSLPKSWDVVFLGKSRKPGKGPRINSTADTLPRSLLVQRIVPPPTSGDPKRFHVGS
jgi:hypothetical protein